uniref:NADH-ubiquinone oxidoreductase chain 4L n=1 Tax=Titiscania limacina TaxID=200181 RepID=A0A1B2G3I0_9GAST|nr:NADH dehydrogenase subunit 4L [Titiscania limacina]
MMYDILFVSSSFLGMVSLLILGLQHKHLLNILLSLEALTLSMFLLLFSNSNLLNMEGYSCLVLISLGACEASLGLAVLVSLIRTHGNDYVKSFTLHKC